MNDVIFETVVTTVAADGKPHVAPMGVRYRGEQVVLMPFKPSTTHDNIEATGHAVLNIVTDTRVFAGCVTGRRDWPVLPAEKIAGVRLACALSHIELRLAERIADQQRPVLRMARVHAVTHAAFAGFNRAQAAVIEGAVLVSRLQMLAAQKVDTPATAKDNAAAPVRDAPARENQKSESRIEARPDAKAEAKVESRAAPKSESKGAKADAAPAPAGEEARVKAILDGKAAAAAGTTGGFAVQIGAFASDDKVREARDKLAVAGYKSYVEKLDTKEGERTRVRAGPFPGRDSAEAARDKIRTLGFDGAAVVVR